MAKQDVAIRVNDIHKEFILPQSKNTSMKQAAVNIVRKNNRVTQKVLDGVSFEVKKGDFFGIVGRNGSGKSTLLKLIAGVYHPTSGSIEINGGLTPFIELGVGFNHELSGRDNIYLNGALLGYNRKQMDEIYDEIVEFAELGPFMDQKLKNYSSGMQVRLAFSIAIKAKNDILIFDEVLAVGDEAFQRKCLDVFEEYKAKKQTVILVTHDMETVRRFCNKAILINEGTTVEFGSPVSVAEEYSRLNQQQIDNDIKKRVNKRKTNSYLKVKILGSDYEPKTSFSTNESMIVSIDWKGLDPNRIESIGVSIFKRSGENITGINSRTGNHRSNWKDKGKIALEFNLNIAPGNYYLLIEAFEKEGKVIDSLLEGPEFIIKPMKMQWSGLTELQHTWHEEIDKR